MPPGASCAHAGMSESLRPVRTATVTMLGRAGAASAGRGPAWVDASTAGSRAAWAGATATAGVWAAAMAPTRTAATKRTGPTERRRGGRGRPRWASAASAAVRIVSTSTSRTNSSHNPQATMASRLRIFRSSSGEASALLSSAMPGMWSGSGQPTNDTSSHGTPPSSPSSIARASRPRSSRPAAVTTRFTGGPPSAGSGVGAGDALNRGGGGGGGYLQAAYPDQLQELGLVGAVHGDGHGGGRGGDRALQVGGLQPAAGGGLGLRRVEFGDVAGAVGGQVELLGSGAGGGLRGVEGLYLGRQCEA